MADQKINYVYFFGHKKGTPLNYLSQWYESSFIDNNITFKTAEHYMMWRKAILFEGPESKTASLIINARTPKDAKSLGRKVKNFNMRVWERNRKNIVYKGNYLKFTQNVGILKKFLKFKNPNFVEASPWDKIWGIGMNSRVAPYNTSKWGLNLLGKILSKLHKKLSNV